MAASDDPFALPRAYWQGLGWCVGRHPLVSRDDLDRMTGVFLRQADLVRPIHPYLAAVGEQMAAEFHGAALDALAKRP